MQVDDLADDRQTQSKSSICPDAAVFRLAERFEKMRQELRRNAFAGIVHNNLDVGESVMRLYLYPPASRGELDSVGEQVPDDLLQTPWIARHQARVCVELSLNLQSFRIRAGAN